MRNVFHGHPVRVLFSLHALVVGARGLKIALKFPLSTLHIQLVLEKNMKTKTNCLFGGALLGAGLCAGAGSSALAGDFVWGLAYTQVAASYFAFDYDYSSGDFGLSVTSPEGGTASAYADSSGFSLLASAAGVGPNGSYGYAFTRGFGSFSVTSDMTVLFEWDVTADSYGIGYGNVFDTYTGMNLFDFVAGDSGDFTVTLLAGRLYSLEHFVISGPGAIGESSFSVSVVPLPPAAFAGLGMLAGLGAYKRIRRR